MQSQQTMQNMLRTVALLAILCTVRVTSVEAWKRDHPREGGTETRAKLLHRSFYGLKTDYRSLDADTWKQQDMFPYLEMEAVELARQQELALRVASQDPRQTGQEVWRINGEIWRSQDAHLAQEALKAKRSAIENVRVRFDKLAAQYASADDRAHISPENAERLDEVVKKIAPFQRLSDLEHEILEKAVLVRKLEAELLERIERWRQLEDDGCRTVERCRTIEESWKSKWRAEITSNKNILFQLEAERAVLKEEVMELANNCQ